MILIPRLYGDPQSADDNERTDDIGGRFYSIGDQRIGISEIAGESFDECKACINKDADDGRADPLFSRMISHS